MAKREKKSILDKKIRISFPSREFANSYFDLSKRILEVTGLTNEDPRLNMSLSIKNSGWYFPLTINFRYVLVLRKKKVSNQVKTMVGTLLPHFTNEFPKFRIDKHVEESSPFSNLPGEYSEPPCFTIFKKFSTLLSSLDPSDVVHHFWQDALIAELDRASSSPFRKYHEPLIYRMAMDLDFRIHTLDRIFPESKPDPINIPEEVDDPEELYEGALREIKVNSYERNLQARKKCLDHYGTRCCVCKMSFEEEYGPAGKGYIQVHHKKPLYLVGEEYEIDPINDLCPVCPNCHTMIHSRKPPYNIEEVQALLRQK